MKKDACIMASKRAILIAQTWPLGHGNVYTKYSMYKYHIETRCLMVSEALEMARKLAECYSND